jgi:hypothetical protein
MPLRKRLSYSTIQRIGILALMGAALAFGGQLAYGWSLGETQSIMALVVGPQWAETAAWLVTFGPQPLLIISSSTREGKLRLFSISGLTLLAGFALNFTDMATNIAAFVESFNGGEASSDFVRYIAFGIGVLMCIGITWYEEIGLLIIAKAFDLVRQILADMSKSAPKWFAWDLAIDLAGAASNGNILSEPKPQPRQERQPQGGNGHRPENRRERQP